MVAGRLTATVVVAAGTVGIVGIGYEGVASAVTYSESITVTGTGDGPGTCTPNASKPTRLACSDLRGAVEQIDQAGASSASPYAALINLPAGVYDLTAPNGALDIAANVQLTLTGSGRTLTKVTGHGVLGDDIFSVAAGATLAVRQLTVEGGDGQSGVGDGSGAGDIYNDGSLSLTNVAVTGGSATYGGGIYNDMAGSVALGASTAVTGNVSDESGGGILNLGNLTLSGASVSSDNSEEQGGGIYNQGTLTVNPGSQVSSDNAEYYGGAIYNDGGSMSVNGARFVGDYTYEDGGAIDTVDGSAAFSNSTFKGDSDYEYGGAIYTETAGTTIAGSTFSGDSTDEEGGALSADAATTVSGSTFTGNSAYGYGGAIANSAPLTLTTSTLSGNSTTYYGGALYSDAALDVENSTFAANTTIEEGGAIYDDSTAQLSFDTFGGNVDNEDSGASIDGGTVQATYDIFDSEGPQCGGVTMTDDGYNVAADTSCGLTGTGSVQGSNVELAPLKQSAPGALQTMALVAGSPAIAIQSGDPCIDVAGDTITTDEVGQPRPDDESGTTGCDAGAFEGMALFVSGVHPKSGPVAGGTAITLTGSGFVSGATVQLTLGAQVLALQDITVVSPGVITGTTPAAVSPGAYAVTVTTPAGTSGRVGNGTFSYSS